MIDVGNLFFSGQLVHIVGTNMWDHGRQCATHHPNACGAFLRMDDWVTFNLVHVEEIDENAIEVRKIVQGSCQSCRVGFLQRVYIPYFEHYIWKVAQVGEVWTVGDKSATQRHMVHRNHECCIAGIMGIEKVEV